MTNQELINSLTIHLDQARKQLRNLSQTRSFFRGGVESTVTIGTASDIAKQQSLVNALTNRLELEQNKPIEIEKPLETMDAGLTDTSINTNNQPQNNTLRNALIFGGLALLVL